LNILPTESIKSTGEWSFKHRSLKFIASLIGFVSPGCIIDWVGRNQATHFPNQFSKVDMNASMLEKRKILEQRNLKAKNFKKTNLHNYTSPSTCRHQ
jgi:hypothetical protein